MEIEHSHTPEYTDEEAHIEQLLSEKLLQGYVLLEKACPACMTPLVKRNLEDMQDDNVAPIEKPIVVPSQSFDQPFHPVEGVPFCVACQSHVVTEESEIAILEKCSNPSSLKPFASLTRSFVL